MIHVFSTRKDKPHAYGVHKPSDPSSYANELPYEPIEFAISKDGKSWVSDFDVPDLDGVYCYDAPTVVPATQTDNLTKIGIHDGQQLISSTYEQREMTMSCHVSGTDEADAQLAFDALQRFLVSREGYWIAFSNWPQRMYFVKAKLAIPTWTGNDWTVAITLTDLIGLSRSIGTTIDHVQGFGNNEPFAADYSFSNSSFTVKNLSDVLIDPERRGHPFKMTLSGSGNNTIVTNKSTGDSITRKGTWFGKFELDGVNPYLNGNHDGINTDHGIITLQIGDNQFEVSNFNGSIQFDFPMWWLS